MKHEQTNKGESRVLFFSFGPPSAGKNITDSYVSLDFERRMSLWELQPLFDRWGWGGREFKTCLLYSSSPWGVVERVIEFNKW